MVDHDTLIRGLGGKGSSAPLILQRTDENVVGVLLETLETSDPYKAVVDTVAKTRTTDGYLRLFQPVHRTFHIALVELICDRPGWPRLDPAKIDSAGLVIRRAFKANSSAKFPQGWLSAGKKLRGWASMPADYLRDPDPFRRKVVSAGSPELARMGLEKARLDDGAEDVTPLFVVPPQICEKSGKTILYALIPTVSSEMSESVGRPLGPEIFNVKAGQKDDFKDAILPVYLKAGTGFGLGVLTNPPAFEGDVGSGRTFTALSASTYTYLKGGIPTPIGSNPPTDAQKKQLDDFLDMLRFLHVSVDAFNTDKPSAEAVAIQAQLKKLLLPRNLKEAVDRKGRPANEALAEAAKALVAQVPNGPTSFTMPYSWPPVSKEISDEISNQIKTALARRLADMQTAVPRFEDLTARYRLRAFVRVKRDDGCPPDLVWSDESEQYMIVPWYENGALPPIQIQLPDIGPDFIKSLKPNVAFKMPRRLFNFLNSNNPKDLIDGKGSGGVDVGLQWICGFNISIIFVLAFIVMFMFLIILNIIFWWLPFIKICFPLPTVSTRDDQ
jgi:hypothetical protein